MRTIPLSPVPNQSFSLRLDNARLVVRLKEAQGVMVADVERNGVTLLSATRVLAGEAIIPYRYLEEGNFILQTINDELPDWRQFGASQVLLYLTADEMQASGASLTTERITFGATPVLFGAGTPAGMLLGNAPRGMALDFRNDSGVKRSGSNRIDSGNQQGTIDAFVTDARGTPATFFGADRLLKTAASNELRLDHDPLTGAPRGALIETAATNLMRQSDTWMTAPWAVGGTYFRQMEAGDHPNLLPGTPVCRYGPTNGNTSFSGNVVRQERSETFAPGWYTTYADFKAVGSATSVRMLHVPILTADTGQVGGVIDLTNGAVLADNMASGNTFGPVQQFYSVSLGKGWFRVVLVFEVVREFSRLNWRSFPYVATSQLVGDGSSGLLATMAQLEAGAAPTSYIATTTAAATRAADQVSFALLSGTYGLTYTFDNGSTLSVSGVSGTVTVPTNLPRRHVANIVALPQ